MKEDIIKVTITEDGLVKLETDQISNANHLTAERLVRGIAQVAGGVTSKKQRVKHTHGAHGTHVHEGEEHHH